MPDKLLTNRHVHAAFCAPRYKIMPQIILSKNPNFNYEKIQKEIERKERILNLSPVISDKAIKKDRSLRIELRDLVQSKKIIIKWLNKVNL